MASQEKHEGDTAAKIVRPAILVHSGPEGSEISFQSSDGEIKFDEARIKAIVDAQNARMDKIAEGYGGIDKQPMGAFDPILDQHSSDSNDRIRGRLNNKLWFEVRDVPKVGKNVACAMTNITFLGEETVARVHDGRIYHLSVGIGDDPENPDSYNTLSETSTVITPAAPGAMLLKKGEKKMSKLQKLHAEAATKRLAKLEEIKALVAGSSTKLVATTEGVKLAKRQSDVTKRLSALIAGKKLTPAEFKKMDVKKLAKLDDESLETVMSTYEAREDVIMVGQRGSTDAIAASDVAKNLEKSQFKKLKSEAVKDFKKLSGGKVKLKGEEEEVDEKKEKLSAVEEHKDTHELGADKEEKPVQMKAHMAKMAKCLEGGNIEEIKECYAEMAKHMEAGGEKHLEVPTVEGAEEGAKAMDSVQAQIDELTTQLGRIGGMVEELMKAEKEEGEAFGKIGEEHQELSPEQEAAEKAKVAQELKDKV